MQHTTNHFLSAARGLLLLLMFLLPLFFLPFTLEPLEMSKQTLLLVLTSAAALCWLGAQLVARSITIRPGWMNLLPVLFALAFILPASRSIAPYLSWVGAHRQEYTSVLTIASLCVLFFLLAQTMKERASHRQAHFSLLLSISAASVLAVGETLGAAEFWGPLPSSMFNTVGTLTSFTALLVVFQSFFLGSWLSHHRGDSLLYDGRLGMVERLLTSLVCLTTLFFLLLLDYAALWALFSLSLAVVFVFVVFRAKDISHHRRLLWPMLMLTLALAFWFVFPGIQRIASPLEITPNTVTSQLVASKTLQTYSSALGSGPGTYLFDYSQFHDLSLNQTDFWNTRFDRAASFVWTLTPTIGMLGMTLLGVFVGLLCIRSIAQILRPTSREEWLESFVHFTPWATLVASAFLLPWNMTLMAAFGIFSGLLASQVMRGSWHKTLARAPGTTLLVSTVFVALFFAFLVGIFATTQRYMAEAAFARAVSLDREGAPLQEVVALLDRASTLNAYHDTYYRNLGEALLARVREELADVGQLDTLTAESAQYVQALTAAAVNATSRATELSPNNVLNWLSRGLVYRGLIPVMGEASSFAVASYQKTTELEPLNPSNWTELGITYLAAAEQVRPLTASTVSNTAQDAQAKLVAILASAQSAFEEAVELKPNYAPAHFQLAVTYERQGRLNDAIGKMERVAQYNQLDVGVFFQLGMLYLQRDDAGDKDRAQDAFEHAVKLAPGYANAHWFLASLYEQKGDLAAAVREVETVLALNPDNALVASRLERLLAGQISTQVPETIDE